MRGPVNRFHFFAIPFAMDMSVAMTQLLTNLRAQDLGATPFQLGLVVVAWGVLFSLGAPFGGRAADQFGRRRTLLTGATLYALSVVFCAVAASPFHLVLASLLGGLGCALFWPSFETLLHAPEPDETRIRLGIFNVSWALGLMTGSAVAGYSYRLAGAPRAFGAVALVVVGVGCLVAWRVRSEIPAGHTEEDDPDIVPQLTSPLRRTGFLYMAWAANFAIFFTTSSAAAIFPKLGRSLGVGDGHIGILLAVVMAAQTMAFLALSRSSSWHYRTIPLLAAPGMAFIGSIAISSGSTVAVFAAGMALIGVARGMTCSASLYYSLHRAGARGASMGIHESIIGAAFVGGPFVGGLVAQHVSLRASFLMSAAVVALGAILVTAIRWSYNLRVVKPAEYANG